MKKTDFYLEHGGIRLFLNMEATYSSETLRHTAISPMTLYQGYVPNMEAVLNLYSEDGGSKFRGSRFF
jgi:hypothetical protein